MEKKWDGQIERRQSVRDHDTLIEVVQILKNQSEIAKIVSENLRSHEQKDESNFDSIRKDILGLQRIVWTATGILIALDALPKIMDLVKHAK